MPLEFLPPVDHLNEGKHSFSKSFFLLVFVVVQIEKVKKERMNKEGEKNVRYFSLMRRSHLKFCSLFK